jgi:Tfp pilus assembly protein PilF
MPEVHFNQAVDYFLEDDLESAKIELEQALQLDPFLVDAHVLSCRIGQREGDYEEALSACRRAIDIAPDYPDLHYHLALTCRALDDLEQARAELERALELRPEYGAVLLELAGVALDLGQIERAEQCLEDYAACAEPDAQHAFLLGRCYEEQGQAKRAREQYEKAAQDVQWEEEARSRLACLDVAL